MIQTKYNYFIPTLFLFLVLSTSFAMAEDVTFKIEIPNEDNIQSGQDFQIRVLLDVIGNKAIKQAEFVLTPDAHATISSAQSGSLLLSATTTFNQQVAGGAFKFGETTSEGTGVSGNDLLFVTLTAHADSAGDVTFTFSNLLAKKGNFARTTIGQSKTITIAGAAAQCTGAVPANANLCVGDDAGLAAGADVLRTLVAACTNTKCEYTCSANFANVDENNANGCEVDLRSNINNCGAVGAACNAATQTCVGGVCTDNPPACNDGRKNGDEPDVDCGGSCADCGIGLACALDTDCSSSNCQGGVCAAGPVCAVGEARCVDGDTREVCNAARDGFNAIDCAGGETCQGGVCQAQGKKQELKNAIDAIADADIPERWDIAFINRLAQIIKSIFS